MQPCIVLDSNIWIKNLLLRTPISLALIYGVVQKGAKIAIPEVVEREIYIHTEKRGLELLDNTLKNIKFLSFFDDRSKKAIDELPDKAKISKALINRLGELDSILLRHEHTFSEMKQALEMVFNEQPPNSKKNQQYKDSLLWQAVLSLANKYLVHFVTGDFGFFKNRDDKQGPADNILKDIKNSTVQSFVPSCG